MKRKLVRSVRLVFLSRLVTCVIHAAPMPGRISAILAGFEMSASSLIVACRSVTGLCSTARNIQRVSEGDPHDQLLTSSLR